MKDQFDEWVKGLGATGGGSGPPVILVAASGGGLRAAYWAAISLAAIQDRAPNFGRHLFAFSGVSGGSLGGALFAALLRDSGANPQLACRPPDAGQERHAAMRGRYASCVRDYMHDDYLSPVLARLLVADFFQWFLPFPVRAFDRATALEYSWEDSYVRLTRQETFREGFARFTRDAGIRSTLPVLLLNTTHVETGRRYVESTVVRGHGGPAAHRMQDAGDVLDVLGIDIPFSTAIDNSARFTYISPAGHLDRGDGIEHGRVVDGGYFENSGLTTLRDVYDILTDNGKLPRSLYVLYLCNDPVTCAADDAPRGAIVPSIADELLSPVRALLHTRDARGSLARASLQDVVAPDRFFQLNVCNEAPPSATSIDPSQMDKAKQRVVSPPLGWLLSKLARDWMDASLAGAPPHDQSSCYARNAKAIAAIEAALKQ